MSDLLYFSEHTLQEAALSVMAAVYITRLLWLLHFKAGKERQAPTGRGDTGPRRGILYSWMNIAMHWSMESTRTKLFLYIQFVIFHLGVVAAITLSFIIPYAPSLLGSTLLVTIFRISVGAAFLVGLVRIVRRLRDPYMRAISSPDDYFSLLLLTVCFFVAVLSFPTRIDLAE